MYTIKRYFGDGAGKSRKIEETAAFLKKIGVSTDTISRIIHQTPHLLDNNLKNTTDLFNQLTQISTTQERIAEIISTTPELLIVPSPIIKEFITDCKNIKHSDESIQAVFSYSPSRMLRFMRLIGVSREEINQKIQTSDILFYYSNPWSIASALKDLRVPNPDIIKFIFNNYKKFSSEDENLHQIIRTMRMVEIGDKHIAQIILNLPFIMHYDAKNVKEVLEYFLNIGVDFERMVTLFTNRPIILDAKYPSINILFKTLKSIDMNNNEILDVLDLYPEVLSTINKDNVNKLINIFRTNLFNIVEIPPIIINCPEVLSADPINMQEIFKILNANFSEIKTIKKIIKKNPSVLSYNYIDLDSNIKLFTPYLKDDNQLDTMTMHSYVFGFNTQNNKKILDLLVELHATKKDMVQILLEDMESNIFLVDAEHLITMVGILFTGGQSAANVLNNITEHPDLFHAHINKFYEDLKRMQM